MKLAYVYQESTNIKKANVYQAYSMVKAFSQFSNVDWYRGYKKISPKIWNEGLDEKRIINLGLGKFESLSRLIFCANTLLTLLLNRPDVIFTRDFAFIYFYSKLPEWIQLKSSIVFESHKIYHKVSEKVSRVQELAAYAIVDRFVTVSEGIKEDLARDFKVNNDDILVAPNGIEPWVISEVNDLVNFKKELNFIYAGSYSEWKGVDTILEASLLLADFPGHIYIVGIEGEVPNYNSDIVTVLPPMDRKDLYKFYGDMDVGIVPTLNHLEGIKYTSPIKFFEYAYAGLGILSSDLSSTRELQSLGFQFQFFEVGNSYDLAEKIINYQPANSKVRQENNELALEYTWNKRAKKIVEWI